ncbi:MAG: Holliday junction branch migration protein RuvA [Bacteroidales bacterium]|nr:Holliday junction branch migration protein RuvA [Bacteroidales bacterium]
MLTYINGMLVTKTPTQVVIDCGGVGFAINISLNTFSKLPEEGKLCKLLTHLQIKEDARVLYGFVNQEERALFRMLISISGVGPSTAQMMLSAMSPSELVNCIANNNAGALQSIKGIGAKTAQRIAMELKDKVSKVGVVADNFSVANNNSRSESLSALVSLGFARQAAEKVVDKVLSESDGTLKLEDIIKQSLKLL